MAYTQFATWAAADCLAGRAETQVREAGEAPIRALATNVGHVIAV
ncbi:hypothetical protein K788_0009133 [Paraburkholderia caribensis MBA4]|uniref:Uncharacterized protein n=1 Tax=Paraburkholderia caribensis MBA4 TaxID=1323664 RepID=A0A0P0RDH2_9BURK|nr:hypothetical protein K788_0009133 [Paraburkholderia caribensis MBA4]